MLALLRLLVALLVGATPAHHAHPARAPVAEAQPAAAATTVASATVTLITKSPIHRPAGCVGTRIVDGLIVHYAVPCQWYRLVCVYRARSGQRPVLVRCYRVDVRART